jgi:hypothetical protein
MKKANTYLLDCKVDDILEFVPDGVQDGGNDDGK